MANEMNISDVNNTTNCNSNDDEKQLFEMVTKNDIIGLQMLLNKVGVADIYDENGMTPLQHAAYKGHKEMVQLLLDQGADVNSCKHEHKYTALHFGALSGSLDICLQLLVAGARTDALNSVSRTPAQMAAFVGNHECTALINNFIKKSIIELIINKNNIKINSTQTIVNNLLLLPTFIDLLHKFIININISPIRILILLKSNDLLKLNIEQIKIILQKLLKYEMTDKDKKTTTIDRNINEILAFKYHYLYYILNTIKLDDLEFNNDCIELYIKRLIKSQELIDQLIKDCVREFIYRDTTIFRQLIASLTTNSNSINKDNDDILNPLYILICLLNGQQFCYMLNSNSCTTCLQLKPSKKCSKCKQVSYCDRECQRLHWFVHKKLCQRNTTNNHSNINNTNKSNKIVDTNEITNQVHNILLK